MSFPLLAFENNWSIRQSFYPLSTCFEYFNTSNLCFRVDRESFITFTSEYPDMVKLQLSVVVAFWYVVSALSSLLTALVDETCIYIAVVDSELSVVIYMKANERSRHA